MVAEVYGIPEHVPAPGIGVQVLAPAPIGECVDGLHACLGVEGGYRRGRIHVARANRFSSTDQHGAVGSGMPKLHPQRCVPESGRPEVACARVGCRPLPNDRLVVTVSASQPSLALVRSVSLMNMSRVREGLAPVRGPAGFLTGGYGRDGPVPA